MERKEHFKMYKSGKLWVYEAITTLSLAMGMAIAMSMLTLIIK